jgi:hypothetical protein
MLCFNQTKKNIKETVSRRNVYRITSPQSDDGNVRNVLKQDSYFLAQSAWEENKYTDSFPDNKILALDLLLS